MNLREKPIEELEMMSYADMTLEILKWQKKSLSTSVIFKEICDLLGYTEDEYTNKIGDFYTSLTTDKRFILLENNEWDIRDNHSVKIDDIDEDEDLEETDQIEEDELEPDFTDQDDIDDNLDEDLDDSDIEDLAIVSDEELED